MMKRLALLAARLLRADAGSVVVETAIVAPVLLVLGLGAYDASRVVARQSELQAGSADVEGIVLAVTNGTATNTDTIKTVLQNSLSLTADKVSVTKIFRCNTDNSFVSDRNTCNDHEVINTYVQVTLTDQYTPLWSKFGIGSAINYKLTRTVQVS